MLGKNYLTIFSVPVKQIFASFGGYRALTLSGPGGDGSGPDDQTHSCQSETSYSMMPKLDDV